MEAGAQSGQEGPQLKIAAVHTPGNVMLSLYGSAHGVVPADAATAWLDALLALDWKRVEGAAAAAANLARLSGDRARDLTLDVRERVITRLEAHRAAPAWIARVREVVTLDEAGERGVFGEALQPGLKLIA